jgi:hypothetical protein
LRKFHVLFVLLLLVSCQYFDKQIPIEKDLLDKEIKAINWNQVDEFPSIINCDSVVEKTARQDCFIQNLSQIIQQKLDTTKTAIIFPKHDTIQVKVTVLANATLQFETQIIDSVSYNKTKIDSILLARLIDFPAIKPAIKRGIPVKTQFILPVILKTK